MHSGVTAVDFNVISWAQRLSEVRETPLQVAFTPPSFAVSEYPPPAQIIRSSVWKGRSVSLYASAAANLWVAKTVAIMRIGKENVLDLIVRSFLSTPVTGKNSTILVHSRCVGYEQELSHEGRFLRLTGSPGARVTAGLPSGNAKGFGVGVSSTDDAERDR